MNIVKNNNPDHYEILRKLSKNQELSQRELAVELGFSLGKINYCLKELRQKGLIKIKKFIKNPKKSTYLYVLTPQGLTSKTRITIHFMKKKLQEYDELKAEMDNHRQKKTITQQSKQTDYN